MLAQFQFLTKQRWRSVELNVCIDRPDQHNAYHLNRFVIAFKSNFIIALITALCCHAKSSATISTRILGINLHLDLKNPDIAYPAHEGFFKNLCILGLSCAMELRDGFKPVQFERLALRRASSSIFYLISPTHGIFRFKRCALYADFRV